MLGLGGVQIGARLAHDLLLDAGILGDLTHRSGISPQPGGGVGVGSVQLVQMGWHLIDPVPKRISRTTPPDRVTSVVLHRPQRPSSGSRIVSITLQIPRESKQPIRITPTRVSLGPDHADATSSPFKIIGGEPNESGRRELSESAPCGQLV
ncbi:MAG: hypothetical protein ABI140_04300 [Jatrophihabitantaceae bacterium]